MAVPLTAAAAPEQDRLFAGLDQVGKDLSAFFVPDDGSRRNLDPRVLSPCAVSVSAVALVAVSCLEVPAVEEMAQGFEVLPDEEHYITPVSAVATVRATFGNVLLSPE